MIVNLIKPQKMFSLTLPHKVKGQYWLTDMDADGEPQKLISIEAVNGEWVAKSNKNVFILDAENKTVPNTVLKALSFFNLKISGSNDRVILFAESIDESRQTLNKFVVREPTVLTIGRTNDNNLCYENRFVSSKHARLSYDGSTWSISDSGSTNGTYVNGYRVASNPLKAGDYIYIMGLKIMVGNNFLAINNPDGLLRVASNSLSPYKPQRIVGSQQDRQEINATSKEYFFRSPRFHREIEHVEIKIDPPPQIQKLDTVPLALILGPSLTMGMTSLSTGLLALNNVASNGGEISQALPTLLMSVSMLLGTVLWPILTKSYEKKQKVKNEKKRQDKYLAYLDAVRDEIKRKCKEQSDILNENVVSPEVCADRIAERKQSLWERVLGQDDFLTLRLGVGDLPLDADIRYPEKKFTMDDDSLQDAMLSLGAEPKQLIDVPISVSLVDNITVGIFGDLSNTANTLKSLILQMVALHSYDELKIMLITDEAEKNEWNFIRPIPHFWNDEKTVRFFATNADEVKELSVYMEKNILSRKDASNQEYSDFPPYYVIVSTSKKLAENCEAIQQMLRYKNNCGFSIILAARELRDLPKESKLVISVDGENAKMFARDDTSGKSVSFRTDKINETAVDNLAQDIATIELDLGSKHLALPAMLTFLEMFNVSKIEHLNSLTRWKENNPTISLQTPIGVDSYGGAFNLDLHEKFHGPHGLVAGMTGSGKSEFIITYILSLAVNYHPDEVAFILIDYKGGGLAGAFEDDDRGIKLPHLAGTITNLDGAAVKRSLISIQSELRRRQAIFNEARKISNEGTMDIYKYQQLYRDKVVSEPIPHLFIISDEFAELKSQQPEFMEQLISAARIGRSLGVHLILATQKPSGVVDDQIWSNSKFRVCLKVQEKADSQDVIKCPDAAELSQTGRFYLQVGFNELFLVDIVNPQFGEHIADPACGSADFLVAAFRIARKYNPGFADCIWGIDNSSNAVQVAVLNMLLNGDGKTNIIKDDSLENIEKYIEKFDVLTCNPPFGTKIVEKRPKVLRKYDLGFEWISNEDGSLVKTDNLLAQQETGILFIEVCVKECRPDGRIAIILPNGYLGNRSLKYRAVRDWILRHTRLAAIVSLPRFTFKSSGADVSASVLYLEKRAKPLERLSDDTGYQVAIEMIERVGWDAGNKKAAPIYKRNQEDGSLIIDENGSPIIDCDFENAIKRISSSDAANCFEWLTKGRTRSEVKCGCVLNRGF